MDEQLVLSRRQMHSPRRTTHQCRRSPALLLHSEPHAFAFAPTECLATQAHPILLLSGNIRKRLPRPQPEHYARADADGPTRSADVASSGGWGTHQVTRVPSRHHGLAPARQRHYMTRSGAAPKMATARAGGETGGMFGFAASLPPAAFPDRGTRGMAAFTRSATLGSNRLAGDLAGVDERVDAVTR